MTTSDIFDDYEDIYDPEIESTDNLEVQAEGIYQIERQELEIIVPCKNPVCRTPMIIIPDKFNQDALPEYCKICLKYCQLYE
jgi:hypothetical protein